MTAKITILALMTAVCVGAAVPGTAPVNIGSDADMDVLSMPLSNQKQLLKPVKKTIDRLLQVAGDTNLSLDLRWKSIMALGFLEGQSITPSYLALANSKEWFVKNGLLIAMDENNHPQRYNVAKKLVKDPSLIVRSTAFDILMQEPTHRDLLWEELFSAQNIKKKHSLWVRPKIIHYMNQNPMTHERALFEKLSKETEPDIVTMANKGLQKIKAMSANETAPIIKAY